MSEKQNKYKEKCIDILSGNRIPKKYTREEYLVCKKICSPREEKEMKDTFHKNNSKFENLYNEESKAFINFKKREAFNNLIKEMNR